LALTVFAEPRTKKSLQNSRFVWRRLLPWFWVQKLENVAIAQEQLLPTTQEFQATLFQLPSQQD
jgi:hypothetical protein